MFQTAILFTFYHELGHLIQKPNNLSLWFTEQYSNKNDYSLEKHILELDADLHGSHLICFHLLEYYNKLEEEKTIENLNKILSIGVASIFSYFMLCFEVTGNIYYKKKSHPHPFLRITYILDCFIKVAEINLAKKFNIDLDETLRQGFKISNSFIKEKLEPSLVDDFSKQHYSEKKNIKNYIDELLKKAESMPNLIMNRKN